MSPMTFLFPHFRRFFESLFRYTPPAHSLSRCAIRAQTCRHCNEKTSLSAAIMSENDRIFRLNHERVRNGFNKNGPDNAPARARERNKTVDFFGFLGFWVLGGGDSFREELCHYYSAGKFWMIKRIIWKGFHPLNPARKILFILPLQTSPAGRLSEDLKAIIISSYLNTFLTAESEFKTDGMAYFQIGKDITVRSILNFGNLLLGDMRGFGNFFLAQTGLLAGFMKFKGDLKKLLFFFEIFTEFPIFQRFLEMGSKCFHRLFSLNFVRYIGSESRPCISSLFVFLFLGPYRLFLSEHWSK
jgi:hypothetical protein